ncbi:MAG: toprim domain-containing protein [Proteobacteria bacterium]|nr:toprim domain-containing protein [Pseudomonadota bacterium]
MSGLHLSSRQVAEVAGQLFGPPNARLSSNGELRFGRRGSLSVVPERGVFCDHESGQSGGLLDMVVFAGAAGSTADAARWLEGGGHALFKPETEKARAERFVRTAHARVSREVAAIDLWCTHAPLVGTAGEAYLRQARAVEAPLDDADLGFLPRAPLYPYQPHRGHSPALVAAVRNGKGEVRGCHLTYLRPDGLGKATLSNPRKMAGTIGGGHVRLIPGRRLVVAEGLESTLSAWEAACRCPQAEGEQLGACAGLSAGGMARFDWPEGTLGLVIAPDRDAGGTGARAAVSLARRAAAEGLSVAFLAPPEGCSDWNDASRKGGVA